MNLLKIIVHKSVYYQLTFAKCLNSTQTKQEQLTLFSCPSKTNTIKFEIIIYSQLIRKPFIYTFKVKSTLKPSGCAVTGHYLDTRDGEPAKGFSRQV